MRSLLLVKATDFISTCTVGKASIIKMPNLNELVVFYPPQSHGEH